MEGVSRVPGRSCALVVDDRDRAKEGLKFPKVSPALRRLQAPFDTHLCEFEVTVAVRTIKVVPKKLIGAHS